MAKWPDIYIDDKPAKKRGMAGSYRKVVIRGMSDAPCGQGFSKSVRVYPSDVESAKTTIRSEINIMVNRHMIVCNRDQCRKRNR